MSPLKFSIVGKRFLLGTATLALAYAAAASALSQAALMRAPDTAMRFAPIAGRADAVTADRLSIAGGDRTDLALVETLAERSLVREPLNPVALRVLGVVADARGQKKQALRLLELSEETSRRDLGTQLALIQIATDRGDLRQTLTHYDRLLRTSVHGQTILFPILTKGLADTEIREELITRLNPPPPWFWAFLNHAIASDQPPQNLALLLGASIKTLPDNADYRNFHARMLGALIDSGQAMLGAQYYKRLPGAKSKLLNDASISPSTTDPRFVPMAWELRTSAYSGATLSADGRAFSVSINPNERATVLRKLLFLSPGSYQIGVIQRQISEANGHKLIWSIKCNNKSIWTDITTTSLGDTRKPFSVPTDCQTQTIALEMVGGNDQEITEYIIDSVRIDPVGR
jgi:hypothetical protein